MKEFDPHFTPVIWDYLDWKSYLTDTIAYYKANRIKPYSLAAVSLTLGFNSKSYLHNLLNKFDVFPSEEVRTNISKWLKFDNLEAKYFDLLVLLSKQKGIAEKNEIFQEIAKLAQEREVNSLEINRYKYFSHWYYPVIKELITLSDWDGKYSTIANWVKPNISVKEVRAAVKDLEQMGIIEKEGNHWKALESNIHSGVETRSTAIYQYQKNLLDLAKVALSEQELSERDISTTTFSLNTSDLPELKLKLQGMQRELIKWINSRQKNEDRILQFNLQLFSLTDTFKHGINSQELTDEESE